VLPLRTAQRQIGGLTFGSTKTDAYSAETIEFMQQVAHQVSVAVDNALNFEAARTYELALARERDRLRALLEINNAVVSSVASKELFRSASASLRRVFDWITQACCCSMRKAATCGGGARFSGWHG